ncbi:MAG: M15 family metallopeptidase [Minisyncoccota bacterium]
MNRIVLGLKAQLIRFKTLSAYRFRGDWRNIPIKESEEPLVQVDRLLCYPFYAVEMSLTDDFRIFLRKSVLDKFLVARSIVQQQGFDLHVYDGWRPVSVQENLFWTYLKKFTVSKFHLEGIFKEAVTADEIKAVFDGLSPPTREMLKQANRSYVSWPSDDPMQPSPHLTGGSVDVWLYKNGSPVTLGVPFDWMEENSGAFYHLKLRRKRFPGNDRAVSLHRNILLDAMTRAGFSAYGPEIWHYNSGNQMDALVTGGAAIYSVAEPPEMTHEDRLLGDHWTK